MMVVGYEEFNALLERVERVEMENGFLKALMESVHWMSRQQAMQALGVSSSKLWTMTKRGDLVYLKEGQTIRYSVMSVHDYLLRKKVDPMDIQSTIVQSLNRVRS